MDFFKKHWWKFITLLIIILVFEIFGLWLVKRYQSSKNVPAQVQMKPASHPIAASQNTDAPPLKLKSIGIHFSDFKFTKAKLQFGRLFMSFGFSIPASPDYPGKKNPQPTFIVPLGTPVRSLVDGIVVATPTLWSKDISVQVTADGKMQKWIYETEHLINPTIHVGDRVTAGQIVGEVSDFNHGAPPGYGTIEIGILKGGNPPQHVCPFAYLDDSIKEETLENIKAIFKSWETYTGDQTLYDESMPIPGCLTLDPIDG